MVQNARKNKRATQEAAKLAGCIGEVSQFVNEDSGGDSESWSAKAQQIAIRAPML